MGKRKTKRQKLWAYIKELYCRFNDDQVSALGAELAYFILLSVFPFLIFILTVLSYTPLTTDEVLIDASYILPQNVFDMLNIVIDQTYRSDRQALLSLGMLGALWASSNGIAAVIRALNRAYDEEETRPFWMVQGAAILYTLGIAFILVLSLALLVFGETLQRHLFQYIDKPDLFALTWTRTRYVLSFCMIILVFILVYKYLPNRRLHFREVLPGAVLATVCWLILSIGFSFYINNFARYSQLYGSLGGIVIFLLWLYWSSVIIIMGGELNATLAFAAEGKERAKCKQY